MYKAFDFIIKYFQKNDRKILLKPISKEVVNYLRKEYKDRFIYKKKEITLIIYMKGKV